jgi:predicted dehydrogenase
MNELKVWEFEEPSPEDEDIFEKWGRNPDTWAWNHAEYLRDVVQSLRKEERGLVDGFEGRKSLELINAIYESAETGRIVSLRFRPQFCRLGME